MSSARKIGLAVLISGRGTNMKAILEAARADEYPAEPRLVLSNRPQARGLLAATAMGVPAIAIDHKTFDDDRRAFEEALQHELTAHGVEVIALAGFMRVLTPWFVNHWRGRLINIHPSLLPKYPGLHTHQRAIDAGDETSGCTVHHVIEGVDQGEIISSASVPILKDDTPDTLAARILIEENRLYPRALQQVCEKLLEADVT